MPLLRPSCRRPLLQLSPAIPRRAYRTSEPRFFAHNGQLLLVVSRAGPRPQLPFLYPQAHVTAIRSREAFARVISTDATQKFKETIRRTVKLGAIFLGMTVAVSVFLLGIELENIDRQFPTPDEWNYPNKVLYLDARKKEEPSENPGNIPNYVGSGEIWLNILVRLEKSDNDRSLRGGLKDQVDPEPLLEVLPGNPLGEHKQRDDFPVARKHGLDISEMSEPWRRGYFDVLMGFARSCKETEDWVIDEVMHTALPKEYMIGPSNPNRTPLPDGYKGAAPREENCIPLPWYVSPGILYKKIMTTTGFTSAQKVEAAIKLADFYQDHGQSESALEAYQWAVDMAVSGLPEPKFSIFDNKSGIITQPKAATANLIRASTAIATHHAQSRDFTHALSTFTSVLRARRAAPAVPTPPPEQTGVAVWIKKLFIKRPYPPAPRSGDEPYIATVDDVCEDAVLMSYIGEVFFAADDHDNGVRWTRDSIELATEVAYSSTLPKDVQEKGLECAIMGLKNSQKMFQAIAAVDAEKQARKTRGFGLLPAWLGGATDEDVDKAAEQTKEKWMKEIDSFQAKINSLRQEQSSRATQARLKKKWYDLESQLLASAQAKR